MLNGNSIEKENDRRLSSITKRTGKSAPLNGPRLIGLIELKLAHAFNMDMRKNCDNSRSIKLVVRKCIVCKALFESLGDRVCGCNDQKRSVSASLMGVELI